jgi:hypothetical protein
MRKAFEKTTEEQNRVTMVVRELDTLLTLWSLCLGELHVERINLIRAGVAQTKD